MYKDENSDKLLNAVLFGTPDDARRVLKSSVGLEHTGRALGAACRLRGLEMVKALVESGAEFAYGYISYNTDMVFEFESGFKYVDLFQVGGALDLKNPLMLLRTIKLKYHKYNSEVRTWINQTKEDDMLVHGEPLPPPEITRSLEYLCANAERTRFVPEWLLYYAVLYCDGDIYSVLKNLGVNGFPRTLSIGSESTSYWMDFCEMFQRLPLNKLSVMLERLKNELGGRKIAFSNELYIHRKTQLLDPDVWRLSLEVFNRDQMNQMQLMKLFINNGAVGCLAICVEYGWLRNPKKLEKLLEYSTKRGRAECTAYLLELKNQAADIPDGDYDFDKMFDLDALPPEDPQKAWNYIKRHGGTLGITGYKGSRTELDVPERIGKLAVTEICGEAFSCVKLQMSDEEKELRRSVTRVTLPPTIRVIGNRAFCGCEALTEVNIPESVTEIGKNAFGGCTNLTLQIFRSSYAESYCINNKVNYIFTEV